MPKPSLALVLITIQAALAVGCGSLLKPPLPQTLGEQNSGYGYIPLDPLPVVSIPGYKCEPSDEFLDILKSLPDNAIRIAVASFDASGQLAFGPVQLGTSGKTYQVVLDYINVDTTNTTFEIGYYKEGESEIRSLFGSGTLPDDATIFVRRAVAGRSGELEAAHGDLVVIPVYVGLGLRLTASVTVLQGNVNLSSLGAIALEAQAGRLTGSLVVQTLGITGSQVITSLPLPSELNSTTVQSAILALGSIKAILYDEAAIKTPRVTGIYNPSGIGGQRLVNALVSELAKKPVEWPQPCEEINRGGPNA